MVGGGGLVYFLARSLVSKGQTIVIVSKDSKECVRLARSLKATVVEGDGTQVSVLDDAGTASCDAVLAVTPNDEDNFVTCRIAQIRYGIQSVYAVVNDPENEKLFHELGITHTVSVTRLISQFIERRSAFETVRQLTSIGENQAHLSEVVVSADSPVTGKALRDIRLPDGCLIGVVLRDGEALIPNGDTVIASGDRLSLLTVPSSYAGAVRAVTGETTTWKQR